MTADARPQSREDAYTAYSKARAAWAADLAQPSGNRAALASEMQRLGAIHRGWVTADTEAALAGAKG